MFIVLLAPTSVVYTFSLHDALPILPPPVAETKLVPAGIASDRLTPVASDGPLFVTVRVWRTHLRTRAAYGDRELFSARLSEVLRVVSSVAVLSEVSGSNTPEGVLSG